MSCEEKVNENKPSEKVVKREYEYRFRNYNQKEIRVLIKSLGGVLIHPYKIYSSTVYNHPYKSHKKTSYIRIRSENDCIKLTVKEDIYSKFAIENEIAIKDRETTETILLALGCTKEHFTEKLREKWELPNGAEIVFDMYPACFEYMEVEASNEKTLNESVKKLGIEKYKGKFGIRDIWKKYFGINNLKKSKDGLKFSNSINILKHVKKNKEMFLKLIEKQKKLSNYNNKKNII